MSRGFYYRKYWSRLLKTYGAQCYYCEEYPMVIDHIVPVTAGGSNGFDNLVPSCALCNLIAANKSFDSLSEKHMHIRKRRGKMDRRTQAICVECLLPYQYRTHSPGLLLCAECYDLEFGTDYSEAHVWRRWIRLLHEAEYDVGAHRKTGDIVRRREGIDRGEKYRILWNFQLGELSEENAT